MNKTLYYTWDQFDKDCERLAQWAKSFDFRSVYGIPRAGTIVATRISYLLDINLITDPHEIDHPDTLVVDDLLRTGKTVSVLEEHIGDFILATLVWSGSGSQPDYYSRKSDGNIFFPWQKKLDSSYENPLARTLATVASIQSGGSIRVDKKGIA